MKLIHTSLYHSSERGFQPQFFCAVLGRDMLRHLTKGSLRACWAVCRADGPRWRSLRTCWAVCRVDGPRCRCLRTCWAVFRVDGPGWRSLRTCWAVFRADCPGWRSLRTYWAVCRVDSPRWRCLRTCWAVCKVDSSGWRRWQDPYLRASHSNKRKQLTTLTSLRFMTEKQQIRK